MDMNKKKSLFVNKNESIYNVLKSIDDSGQGIAIVIGKSNEFMGIATDGDIRRSLLQGNNIDDSILKAANMDPIVVNNSIPRESALSLLTDKIKLIPVLDKNKIVVDVLTIEDIDYGLDIYKRKVCVLGLGYVGLPLSLVLADRDFEVIGYDIHQELLDKLNKGTIPFHEQGLDSFLQRHLGNKFSLCSDLSIVNSDIYIITVGTPVDDKSKVPIIDYIEQASNSIGSIIKKNDLIILRSTVTVGVSRNIVLKRLEKVSGLRAGKDFSFAYAPERTIEGNAISEIQELPQIIGGLDNKSTLLVDQFFRKITSTIVDVGSLEGAEMVKILNNTYRDTKFAYANEMALVCKELGLDAVKLIKAANMDYKRDVIPLPSPGVGGACLTKDPYILIESCKNIKSSPQIVKYARNVNEMIPKVLVNDIMEELLQLKKEVKSIKVLIIGFAFKGSPETSDIRGSTTIDLLNLLVENKIPKDNIFGYDPVVHDSELNNLGVKPTNLKDGFKEADVVVIMNNHKSYKNMDIFSLIESAKDNCLFVDGWYTFEPKDLTSINNIKYLGVGCKI